MNEAGEGQFGRPTTAADGVVRFEDDNLAPGPGNDDGRREAVRPRADDDCVWGGQRTANPSSGLKTLLSVSRVAVSHAAAGRPSRIG